MTTRTKTARNLIEGRPALIVIDIQKSTFIDNSEVRSIDNMPGYKDRMIAVRDLVDAAHENDIPVLQDVLDLGHLALAFPAHGSDYTALRGPSLAGLSPGWRVRSCMRAGLSMPTAWLKSSCSVLIRMFVSLSRSSMASI